MFVVTLQQTAPWRLEIRLVLVLALSGSKAIWHCAEQQLCTPDDTWQTAVKPSPDRSA